MEHCSGRDGHCDLTCQVIETSLLLLQFHIVRCYFPLPHARKAHPSDEPDTWAVTSDLAAAESNPSRYL